MVTEIVMTVRDASGDEASTSVKVGGVPSLVQLNAFSSAWATALNNIIGGKIMGAIAKQTVNLASLTGNLLSNNADVEHTGKFVFLTGQGNRVLCNIPALSEVAIGATTSDELNQAQANVAAFIAAMEDGISVTDALIEPCDEGEDDIVSTVFAREAFRNSGAKR